MALEKVMSLKHGISENGELQVYVITKILKDGKLFDTQIANPYSPTDINNMDDFDDRSKEIVEAVNAKTVKTDFETEKQNMIGEGLEEIVSHDRVVEESGAIAIREVKRIFEDGKEISKKYHRTWINPGTDPSGKDVLSKAVAEKLHTLNLVKTYKEKQKSNEPK